MNEQEFSSSLLEGAVGALSRLPGVGRKTALRLALHILRRPESEADALGQAIIDMRHGIRYCSRCHNISETEICDICSDSTRDASTICVVESVNDVLSVERTGRFGGLYHVLGGVISPIDGISPSQLEIDSLIDRITTEGIREVILTLSPTMEGDTTAYYIYRRITSMVPQEKLPSITRPSRGLAVGDELQHTDELTLGRSILDRRPFDS